MNTVTKKELDLFLSNYIDCALWSSNDESTPSGGEPFDRNYSRSDISENTLAWMRADCERFLTENLHLIDGEGREDALVHAGHDFWLTRNGHGAGFWDGDWPINGGALDKACEDYREQDLYLGDDGEIHI